MSLLTSNIFKYISPRNGHHDTAVLDSQGHAAACILPSAIDP
ncbi:hypothetical protein MY4038_002657 [Beauveria bassiana]